MSASLLRSLLKLGKYLFGLSLLTHQPIVSTILRSIEEMARSLPRFQSHNLYGKGYYELLHIGKLRFLKVCLKCSLYGQRSHLP